MFLSHSVGVQAVDMFDPNDAGVEDAQIEAKSSTNSLGDLPHELVTGILNAADDDEDPGADED